MGAAAIVVALQVPYYYWWIDKVQGALGWGVSVIAIPAIAYLACLHVLSMRRGYPSWLWSAIGVVCCYVPYWFVISMWTLSGD